jgi:transmembrane sensor
VQRKIGRDAPVTGVRRVVQRSFVYQVLRLAAIIIFCIGSYFLVQRNYHQWTTSEVIAVSRIDIKTVILPDGTRVHLNTGSTLKYPEKFDLDVRQVWLEGEAFFEVAEDKRKPFIIRTGEVFTEVVGTSFNVNTKADNVTVSVLTGKVLLYNDKANAIAMTVGEQGVYRQGVLHKKRNDANFLSWKTKLLTFHDTPLSMVVNDLNKHYNERIEISQGALEGCTLTATFQNQSINEILNELRVLFSLDVKKSGTSIIIGGQGC